MALGDICGGVLERGDGDYEATRRRMAWNAIKPDRFPEVIVQPRDEADVVRAVEEARLRGLRVAVRSGGHRWGSPVLRDGGMLIDLGALDFCEIDQASGTARLGPALRNDRLLEQLHQVGLTFPAGHCASVPVGGYLLNGGLGWNHATFGPSCFSVLSLKLVTAAGELIIASETENPDYFWAARGGGGGFFGVVVEYTVRVYPAPGHIQMSTLAFPAGQAEAVGRWLQAIVPGLPRGVETIVILQPAPPPLRDAAAHLILVGAVAFADDQAQADAWLAPIRDCPIADPVMANHGERMDNDKLFALMDSLLPAGKRVDGEALMVNGDAGDLLNRSAERLRHAPSPACSVLSVVLPPPDAPPPPDCAFSLPGQIAMFAYAVWDHPDQDSVHAQWLDQFAQTHRDATAGCYIGESRLSRGPSQSQDAFSPDAWLHYRRLKERYDPDNLFHWFLGNQP